MTKQTTLEGAAETPMSEHVARFWQILASEHVRILVDMRRDTSSAPYWDSASFPDSVAKALVASDTDCRRILERIAGGDGYYPDLARAALSAADHSTMQPGNLPSEIK